MTEQLPLPLFDGRRPAQTTLSVSGSLKDPAAQPDKMLKLGDIEHLVVLGEVAAINHTVNNDGEVSRDIKFKISEANTVDATRGQELLVLRRGTQPIEELTSPVAPPAATPTDDNLSAPAAPIDIEPPIDDDGNVTDWHSWPDWDVDDTDEEPS